MVIHQVDERIEPGRYVLVRYPYVEGSDNASTEEWKRVSLRKFELTINLAFRRPHRSCYRTAPRVTHDDDWREASVQRTAAKWMF